MTQMSPPIKLDAVLEPSFDLANVGQIARSAEALGFDGLWSTETRHDPFIQLALAAETTETVELGTGIALGFTRSPMTIAYTAWDLAALSHAAIHPGHLDRRSKLIMSVDLGFPGGRRSLVCVR